MAVIKCKMCGGDMEISADKTFGTCEYCGSTMTLPKVSDDQRAAAFNRGNHFRRSGEFDKALGVYERIVAEDDTDAEAHWCCALCRFGIEYVEDPATYEWLPTCHRASFDSFLEDVDYLAALEHSDGITRRQYQKDAAKIAEVQRGILATSQNTEPYDVFISYKELDENGERTRDSVLAQDIYYQLTEQGRRVFFSRISLEDIPGTQYEPYIFAALNSAKVMIVVGTSAENLNAVWVKNEWSRFLAMMRKDKTKLLIPCYRDMDPYDMPEQLTVLMSYDMSKIGFIQDLIRSVNKVLDADKPKKEETVHETVVVKNEGGANAQALLKRGNMALEDKKWDDAKGYFDRVLDMDAECAEAYLGLFFAERQSTSFDEDITTYAGRLGDKLADIQSSNPEATLDEMKLRQSKFVSCISENTNLKRAKRFASSEQLTHIETYERKIAAAYTELEQKYIVPLEADISAKKKRADEKRNLLQGWLVNRGQTIAKMRQEEIGDLIGSYIQQSKVERDTLAEQKQKLERSLSSLTGLRNVLARSNVAHEISSIENQIKALDNKSEQLMRGEINIPELRNGVIRYRHTNPECTFIQLQNEFASKESLAAGSSHTVGLKSDGTVVAVGSNDCGKCNMSDWATIVAVSAGDAHTVGLKADGTVVAVGSNNYGRCNVSDWTNIAAVSAGSSHTVGLKNDGTVVTVGSNTYGQCNVSGWMDIVAVSAGTGYTVGLKANGTVVAVGYNDDGRCNVSSWTDIAAVSAGSTHTVGLKADGTAVAAGDNTYGQCDLRGWTDIIAVSAGVGYTVGLKADGTVVAIGSDSYGKCNVRRWTDIVAVSAGSTHTVGLKADGTVVATKYTGDQESYHGQCNVDGWTDIRVPER
ncbi:MAG: TIR domain-containing protein [Oscillospiraceae bacterium]|nr:TIR domain-containing protein [Oscillospiraceae bacterium]